MQMRTILLILIPFSCFAQKRLVPFEFNIHDNSETYSVISIEGVSVYAECIDVKREVLVFDIEIKNESRRTLLVDPEEIY